jgi:hypothetical protein
VRSRIRGHEVSRRADLLTIGLAVLSACSLASVFAAQPRFGPIAIDAKPVVLDPRHPALTAFGDFQFRGGLVLSSRDTNQLHELSDLVMTAEDRFIAVGDEGTLLEARFVLDGEGRLTGVTDAVLTQLIGMDGRPLGGPDRDAEGLALLRSGDRLVSFEGNARIWRYPKDGGRPRPAATPRVAMPFNAGLEALTENPDAGDDAYLAGAEESGETWACRMGVRCTAVRRVTKGGEYGLVAMTHLPEGMIAYLLRAFDPVRRSRITLQIMRGGTLVSRLDLAQPLAVDNFEGVTSWPAAGGRRRFYLVSDDNNLASQRTLLLAFDWLPPERP